MQNYTTKILSYYKAWTEHKSISASVTAAMRRCSVLVSSTQWWLTRSLFLSHIKPIPTDPTLTRWAIAWSLLWWWRWTTKAHIYVYERENGDRKREYDCKIVYMRRIAGNCFIYTLGHCLLCPLHTRCTWYNFDFTSYTWIFVDTASQVN